MSAAEPAFPSPDETLEVPVEFVARCGAGQRETFSLIDCREEDEFAFCRLGGAQLAPLSRFGEAVMPLLPEDRDKPVVVYCHHGFRSAQAAQFLRSRGFANAFSLAGGIDAWSQRIDPQIPRY